MNKKNLFLIPTAAAILFASFILINKANEPRPDSSNNKIVITTNKKTYRLKENIKIAIINGFDTEKKLKPVEIQKLSNASWVEIKQIDCPCGYLCDMAYGFSVKPKKTIKFTWNQKEEWCEGETMSSLRTVSLNVTPGVFRLASGLLITPSDKQKETPIYSEEFTIN
ncbi:hypothetical protein HY224_01000 [Candidatus Uhrbacteria bacterium]|nr:hypothetical protein [Candidatus Uhrbacteria bacterium]